MYDWSYIKERMWFNIHDWGLTEEGGEQITSEKCRIS